MNNQKGEVVTGVMVVIMAVAMVFGMVFMHGGRDHGRNDHAGMEQQKEHSNHDGHKDDKPISK
jgi:high-affinity Fe2+/Pb2+ permease